MEEIKLSKPHLRQLSPLIYWISWCYGLTNLAIGAGTYKTPLAILKIYPFVREPFGPHFYGGIFILMGVAGIISLITKQWRWTRRVMMFGLMVKSLFFYGLILNLSWLTLGITGVWALIFSTQFLTVVYFPKKQEKADGTR